MFSVDGLASGLDTASIIEGALAAQQARVDRLNLQRRDVEQEQTAFKTLEGQLFGLQGSLRNILRSSNNAFDKKSASSSDAEAVDVSASSRATAGTYRLRVAQLAQSHQIKTNGFADESELIGEGTLTIQVGKRAQAEIAVDADSTLSDLANAINSQASDVQATLIDDGSSEAPIRLLLTSRFSGSENAITIHNNLTTEGNSAVDFSGPAVQAAQDAQVQIGTGEGAIIVSSEDNQFDSLVSGVSLDVLQADPEKDIVVTVAEDTKSVVDAIQGFVDAYNDVIDFIDSNSTYDTETNSAGLLLGNRSAASVQSSLRSALSTVVEGAHKDVRTYTSIGISTTATGKLSLDSSKLQDLLDGRVEGAGMDDIRRLFAIDGKSDNPGVEFVLGTNKTSASPLDPETRNLLPYEVEITRAAAAAQIESVAPLLENTVINGDNGVFRIEVDRTPIEVKIPADTYSRTALAEQLQTLINTAPERAGRQVEIKVQADNRLSIASTSFGDSSILKILSGSGNSQLGLTEALTSTGVDVAGVFRVQVPGEAQTKREEATGNGRTLTGDSDNEYTAQLQIRSNLRPSQVGGDPDARLTVTRGIGAALDAAIGDMLRSGSGELASIQDRYAAQIEAIDDNIKQVETRLESRRETLARQFAALEVTLSELQSTGDTLTSSLLTL